MTADRAALSELPMGAHQEHPLETDGAPIGKEHQSSGGQVLHNMHGFGRQPTDRYQTELTAKSKAATA